MTEIIDDKPKNGKITTLVSVLTYFEEVKIIGTIGINGIDAGEDFWLSMREDWKETLREQLGDDADSFEELFEILCMKMQIYNERHSTQLTSRQIKNDFVYALADYIKGLGKNPTGQPDEA